MSDKLCVGTTGAGAARLMLAASPVASKCRRVGLASACTALNTDFYDLIANDAATLWHLIQVLDTVPDHPVTIGFGQCLNDVAQQLHQLTGVPVPPDTILEYIVDGYSWCAANGFGAQLLEAATMFNSKLRELRELM